MVESGRRAVVIQKAEFDVIILEIWSSGAVLDLDVKSNCFGMNGFGLAFAFMVYFLIK